MDVQKDFCVKLPVTGSFMDTERFIMTDSFLALSGRFWYIRVRSFTNQRLQPHPCFTEKWVRRLNYEEGLRRSFMHNNQNRILMIFFHV